MPDPQPPKPPLHPSAKVRLVLVVQNDLAAFQPLLYASLRGIVREVPDCLLIGESGELHRSLTSMASQGFRFPDPGTLPSLENLRQDAVLRWQVLETAIKDAGFLECLPFEPNRTCGPVVWDRLQRHLVDTDERPFVTGLPWESIGSLDILGGVSFTSAIPLLVISEARSRQIPVHGRVIGPVVGRWAPLWIHGCDTLTVPTHENIEQLRADGFDISMRTDAALSPRRNFKKLRLESGSTETLHLDVHPSSSRRSVRRALAAFLESHADSVWRVVVHVRKEHLLLMQQALGDQLGGVPLTFTSEDILQICLAGNAKVLSCEPYRVFWAGGLLPETQIGFLEDEVRRALGFVPAAFQGLLKTSSRGAAP